MNRALTLASSVAGAAVVALDGTVLTVAQPTLRRDLHASVTQVQWTSTGYLVAVAGLLAARAAGVAGGLQQTAMNVGPALGVASATVLMGHVGTRSPLVVLAVVAATAVPVCRALPGRSRPAPDGPPAGRPAGVAAGRSDTEHTGHGVERGPFPPSLRDHDI